MAAAKSLSHRWFYTSRFPVEQNDTAVDLCGHRQRHAGMEHANILGGSRLTELHPASPVFTLVQQPWARIHAPPLRDA